jgi:flagellar protein FlgJ
MSKVPSNVPNALDFSQYTQLRADAQQHDPKNLHKVAQQFESLFTQMMLKSMRATHFGDDGTGQQGDFYKDLLDQQLSTSLAAGKGVGLADMLVRQLGGVAQTPNSAATGGFGVTPIGGATANSASSMWTKPGQSAAAGAAYQSVAVDSVAASAESDAFPTRAQQFVDSVRPHAEKAAAELGVPARALIAQAALETGWGQHMGRTADGKSSLNLFGIKASGSTPSVNQLTTEYENGQAQQQRADFRAYRSVGESFDDYVKLLKGNPRYADALRAGGDISQFAASLQKAGYATDPNYAAKLVRVANSVPATGAGAASRHLTSA